MKTKLTPQFVAAVLLFATLVLPPSTVFAQGTAFTYQGHLQNNGSPASGTYNLTFSLFNTSSGGSAVAGPVTTNGVIVTYGLFTVLIDFGSGAWNGATNWLQVGLETNGTITFTNLTPRQELTPAPYAIYAKSAGGLPGLVVQPASDGAPNLIGGSPSNFVSSAVGATIGGGGATNYGGSIYINSVTGNFGTVGGGAANAAGFLGTVGGGFSDSALGTAATASGGYDDIASGSYATVGGGAYNTASGSGNYATVSGGYANTASGQFATIGGGSNNIASGYASTVAGGDPNNASGPYSFIGGGNNNTASGAGAVIGGGGYDGTTVAGNFVGDNAATIGGGLGNSVPSGGTYGFIGGGQFNTNAAANSTIGGGAANYIEASAGASTIGGGANDTIQPSATDSTIGGGTVNSIQNGAYQSTIAGGNLNVIQSSAEQSTIAGGDQNIIQADSSDSSIGGGYHNTNSGGYATIPGGEYNVAGANSFAAGSYARATNSGSFVWSDDSSTSPFSSTNNNSFNVRAEGGVRLVTGGAGMTLDGLPVLTGSISGGNYWQTTGNSGTTAGVNFVGTTDTQPLEMHVDGARALRLEPGNGYNAPNVVGGSFINFVTSGVGGATIGGGGTTEFLPGTNSVTADFGTVGGGIGNTVGNGSAGTGTAATVGGGQNNNGSGAFAAISGGEDNVASGEYTAVSGGYDNTASAEEAAVGGGYENNVSGIAATVPGGNENIASGEESFAAGSKAQAANNNSFVWSDGSATTASTVTDQFMVRASGGVIIYSSSANTAGVSLAAGSGTWGSLSDRNAKDDFAPVTPQQVLAKVAALPITKWSYKTEQGVQHIGPMAQDFHAAFGVGEDNKHITTVDEDGVALAAIQGLNQKLNEKDQQIQDLKRQNDSLAKQLNHLESVVESLANRK